MSSAPRAVTGRGRPVWRADQERSPGCRHARRATPGLVWTVSLSVPEPLALLDRAYAGMRAENYFRYARTRFALGALDSYAAAPDEDTAATIPARVPLGTLAPDMVRLDAETKQITHAIRMAAYNTETALARALDGALCPRQRRGLRVHPRGPQHLRRHLPRRRRAAHPARPAYRAPAHPDPGRALRAAHRHRRLLSRH
jgi:hypothetical protein